MPVAKAPVAPAVVVSEVAISKVLDLEVVATEVDISIEVAINKTAIVGLLSKCPSEVINLFKMDLVL